MINKKNTPFEDRSLLATRNVLHFDGVAQRVNVNTDARYGFGSNDMALSVISQPQNLVDDPFFLEMYNASSNALIRIQYINTGAIQLTVYTDQGTNFIVVSPVMPSGSLVRFTMIRRGSNIEAYVNEKLFSINPIPALDTLNFNDVGGRYSIGSRYNPAANMFQGFIGSLIFLNQSISLGQLETISRTNVIPFSLHQYVVAHYAGNQDYGQTLFDVVEQYNYAKVTALSAIHGVLFNYTNDETGVTNPMLQTAWINFYNRKRAVKGLFQFDGVDLYGQLNGPFAMPAFTIYLDVPPHPSPGTQSEYLLMNRALDTSNPDLLLLRRVGVELRLYVGTAAVPAYIESSPAPEKNNKIILSSDGVTMRMVVIREGVIVSDSLNMMYSISSFDLFNFGTALQYAVYYTSYMTKAVIYNRNLNDYERRVLMTANESDGYKSIPNRFADWDMRQIFLNAGTYYVTDDSGNGNNLPLVNFDPVANQPSAWIKKALRFVRASGHYGNITGATIASTNYTYVLGMRLDSDRDFMGSEYMMNSAQSFIIGLGGTKQTSIVVPGNPSFSSSSIKKTDTPFFIIADVKDLIKGSRINGFDDVQSVAVVGVNQSFPILLGDAVNGLDGYIFHFSIWRDKKSKSEIMNIVNNTLSGQSEMVDCELYLDFNKIINTAGVYTIPDLSPQNRSVVLNNYTLAEITPGNPAYKLFDLDSLR